MDTALLRAVDETVVALPGHGALVFAYPEMGDMTRITGILQSENLDTRRLAHVSSLAFPVMSAIQLAKKWSGTLNEFAQRFPDQTETLSQIQLQSAAMLKGNEYPPQHALITDPFHMAGIEHGPDFSSTVLDQIRNCIVAKSGKDIISIGRLLDVEGFVELVSLWTHPGWRCLGLAARMIDLLLAHSKYFPVFSFQKVPLLPYYLSRYRMQMKAEVAQWTDIPRPLQRDLVRMNLFWGPYTIIRIHQTDLPGFSAGTHPS